MKSLPVLLCLKCALCSWGHGTVLSQEPAAGSPDARPPLPPGVLAQVNGKDITVNDYVAYLFESLGKSRLDEFIDRLLIEEEAARLEIVIEKDEVEAAVEDRLTRTVDALYEGSRERLDEHLAKRRTTFDEYKARLRQDLYYDRLWSEVILKTRQVTEAELRQQFNRTYGEGGVRYVIRHILISARGDLNASDTARSAQEAREKAGRVLKEVQAGGDFAQAVKKYSDDVFTRANGGRIPHYSKGFFGDSFHEAVVQLTPEARLSGVVESPRGYHLIELVEKRVTVYEDVKAELEKSVQERASTPAERHDLIRRLRAAAKVVE